MISAGVRFFLVALAALTVSACSHGWAHFQSPSRFVAVPLPSGLGGEQSRWVRLDTWTGQQELCTYLESGDHGQNQQLRCFAVLHDQIINVPADIQALLDKYAPSKQATGNTPP